MGQQQLLLIVLGVIIVGIAVVVGINVFTASSVQANADALVADLTNLAANAQQHFRKPGALGGGGSSFDGSRNNGTTWAVPASLVRTGNMSADVAAVIGADEIELTATGTEDGSAGGKITVVMTVGPNEITETVINLDN